MKKYLLTQTSLLLFIFVILFTNIEVTLGQETNNVTKGEQIEFNIEQLRKIAESDTSNMIIIPRIYDKPMAPGDPVSLKLDLRGIAQPDIINFGQPALNLLKGVPIYAHRHGIDTPGFGSYDAIGFALVSFINDKTRLINSGEVLANYYSPFYQIPYNNYSVYSAMEYDVDEHLTLSTYGRHIRNDNNISNRIRNTFSPQNIIGGSAKFKINDNVKVRVGVEVRQY